MKRIFKKLSIFFLVIFVISCSQNPEEPHNKNNQIEYEFGDGYRLYNLIPLFLDYAEKAGDVSDANKLLLWNSELEQKYPDFFSQVLYRNMQGNELLEYKSFIINEFWRDIVPRKKSILKEFHTQAVQKILNGRTMFKNKFADFQPDCDYYLTIAFSFFGKAVELNGKTILAIGLENFEPNDVNLDFTIAHEQYHLYHFGKGFSASGGLYRGIWSEGLATYCQLYIHPGNYTYSQVLGFPRSRIDEINEKFEFLKQHLFENLTNSDNSIKRAYLGVEDNNLGIPPACGYYFGLRIVLHLIENGYTLPDMSLWTAEQALVKIKEVLPNLK